ncbi:hypothetical protein TFLX_04023 [Thermoflexales bacterium]|nr:hypothetical protein TFLX_04023 [Thermoflexales bacterium]
MSHNLSDQVTDYATVVENETRRATLLIRNAVVRIDSVASNPFVQCYLIAARRGRQIRLAREQVAQRQQSGSRSNSVETPQSDET